MGESVTRSEFVGLDPVTSAANRPPEWERLDRWPLFRPIEMNAAGEFWH